MAIALSGLPIKAPARARKEERGVVLTLQLMSNGEMALALHRCNFMKKISRLNFWNMAAQAKLLSM